MNAAPGHADFLAALMRAAFTDDGQLLFVSAGVDGGAGFGGKLAAACFDARGQMVDVIEA